LVAIDLLSDDRRAVADQVGYLLDGYAVVAHDRDERSTDVGRVERRAHAGRESQVVVLPCLADPELLLGLLGVMLL
jgi:hypothetical protein